MLGVQGSEWNNTNWSKLCDSFTAAGDDPVHLPVQEHSHRGLHQSAKVLKVPGGGHLVELNPPRPHHLNLVKPFVHV